MYTDIKKNYGVFFKGENAGPDAIALTGSSANHVANMAKEYTQDIKRWLDGVKLVNRSMKLADSNVENIVQKGIGEQELAAFETQLDKVSQCNALIAWIREAIKAKEVLLNAASELSVEDYCNVVGKQAPVALNRKKFFSDRGLKENEQLEEPVCEECITEGEAISLLNDEDRKRYHMLVAEQNALEALIGEDGSLSLAVKELQLRTNNSGEDGVSFSPSVDPETVFSLQRKLQGQLARVSAELMALKEKAQAIIADDKAKKNTKYEQERLEYEEKQSKRSVAELDFATALDNYAKDVASLQAEMETFKIQEQKCIGEWKVIIPPALVKVYNEVNSLGK